MGRLIIACFFILFICDHTFSRTVYLTRTGNASFTSNAPLEIIKAQSDEVMGAIDLKDRTFIFTMDNNSFKGFNSSLQQEHFYENYLETQLYPKSTFKGKIIEEIDLRSTAEQVVRAKGMLEIHGVTQERIIKGTLRINNGKIHVKADFSVLLDDHQIKIPRVVNQKIAESIDVSVTADLTLDTDQQGK